MADAFLIFFGWALIALGAVGCFVPVMPGPIIAYSALLVARAVGDHSSPTAESLVVSALVVAAVVVFDYVVPAMGAKKFNCSRLGVIGCVVGTFTGLFFLPLGVVLGPFLGALAGELIHGKELASSLKGAFGAFLGFVAGLVVKFACCCFIAFRYYAAVS